MPVVGFEEIPPVGVDNAGTTRTESPCPTRSGLRVAFITGRSSHYRLPIFQRLNERHTVDFFFTGAGGGRFWLKEHSESLTAIRAFDASSPTRLFLHLRSEPYDAIVTSLAGRSHLLAVATASRAMRIPIVLWVAIWAYPQSPIHQLGRPVVHALLKSANAIVAYGPHVTRWIEDEVGRTRGIVQFWNAVDNAHFSQFDSARVDELRASLPLRNQTLACFVGRHSPEKGLTDLFTALTVADSDVGLVVVGAGRDTGAIREIAAVHDVSDRIAMVGYVQQDDLPNYYALTDFLVMPSVSMPTVREAWGLVANEAMNAGRPVIATTAVGAAAGGLVQDRRTGLVVRERDPAALANALFCLTTDVRLRLSLGEEARRHVQKWNFDAATASFERALAIARGEFER
jgi:glycosyltransferase involved in cell wall biosynthesis